MSLAFENTPRISLGCELVPVYHREYVLSRSWHHSPQVICGKEPCSQGLSSFKGREENRDLGKEFYNSPPPLQHVFPNSSFRRGTRHSKLADVSYSLFKNSAKLKLLIVLSNSRLRNETFFSIALYFTIIVVFF